MQAEPTCGYCKYFDPKNNGYKCPAFPNGIPDDILVGVIEHYTPLPGQENDIVFEPIAKDTNPQESNGNQR